MGMVQKKESESLDREVSLEYLGHYLKVVNWKSSLVPSRVVCKFQKGCLLPRFVEEKL